MSCNRPLTAYGQPGGGITFNRAESSGREVPLPCGQCMGCRLQKSNEWALRAVNEMLFHDESSFITLTYDPRNLPEDGSLNKEHLTNFWKRLRKRIYPTKIRYIACGEYGEQLERPHYHAIVFGYGFPDKEKLKEGNKPLWTSKQLSETWGKGFVTVTPATFETARYVAKYVVKRQTGDIADTHYGIINETTGELLGQKQPEYLVMSRKPGIGLKFFNNFLSEIYPDDCLIHDGVRYRVPRYYDTKLAEISPELLGKIKKDRKLRANQTVVTPARRRDREIILNSKQSKRNLSDDL